MAPARFQHSSAKPRSYIPPLVQHAHDNGLRAAIHAKDADVMARLDPEVSAKWAHQRGTGGSGGKVMLDLQNVALCLIDAPTVRSVVSDIGHVAAGSGG